MFSLCRFLLRRQQGTSKDIASFAAPVVTRGRSNNLLRRIGGGGESHLSSSAASSLLHSTQRRFLVHEVDARNFEAEVLQSQQAVCLLFHCGTSGNRAFLKNLDDLSEKVNGEVETPWLKLCAIDADRNQNLASAFSVERLKLPVTFFIVQAGMVDRVNGHVPEERIESILRKFMTHYQSVLGVNFAKNKNPHEDVALPNLQKDLQDGATTEYLQNSIFDSLVGASRVRLPEEVEKLEGLKRTIQQAKRQAYTELEALHREIGMDVKRLPESLLNEKYYTKSQFRAAGILSALEALFLARFYGSVGKQKIEASNVTDALGAFKADFQQLLGLFVIKQIVALIEVNIVRGDCREIQHKCTMMVDASQAEERQELETYARNVLVWVDAVDGRATPGEKVSFPADTAEAMLTVYKKNMPWAKKDAEKARRAKHAQTCLLSLVALFPESPAAMALMSRLSSLMH